MQRRKILLGASALLLTAACSFSPKVDPSQLDCKDDNGCPSGYRCVGATVDRFGLCCNKLDAAACFPSPDAPSAPTDAPADGIVGVGGSVDAFAEALVTGDGVAGKREDVSALDSGADVAGGGLDAGTGGTSGRGEAGTLDAPEGQPDLSVGGTDGGATGGAGGSGDARTPDAADGPVDVPIGGAGGNPGTGGSAGVGAGGSSGAGGTTSTGGVGTGGGTTAAGGTTNAGGNTTAGGSPGSGGTIGSGGTPGSGGVVSSGGSSDAGTSPTNQSAGCGTAPTITQYNNGIPIPITVNGSSQRRYILNVPNPYVNTTPYKLILAFHELHGNDVEMYSQRYYELLPRSNNTTIFVAPNGVNGSTPCSGTGSGDQGCGWPYAGGSNMAFVDALVSQIEQNFCVDTNRIFATGWSYGASMSYEVGCERPLGVTSATWGVRAIAIYSGAQMSGSCSPSTPVAYYASHGIRDGTLSYGSVSLLDGGVSGGGLGLCQKFAMANGCTWALPTAAVASGPHVCTQEADCKTGYPVEFCSFDGDHTAYPDSGLVTSSWGPQEAWSFLNQF